MAYIFYRTEAERDNLRRELRRVAKKYKEYVTFAVLDATEYGHIADNLELRPGVFPAFVLHNGATDQVFPFSQRRKIAEEAIDVFVLDILQGKVTPGRLVEENLDSEGAWNNDHDEL